MIDAAYGHTTLLHRLQQGGLRFGGRAVDLVGEKQVGEQRPRLELEPPTARLGVFLQQVRAGDVGRHQVGGELDASIVEVGDSGEG